MKRTTLYSALVAAAMASAVSATATAATYEVRVTNLTAGMHFTPLILANHSPSARMFTSGAAASPEMQAIAEGGDVSSMAALLDSIGATVVTGEGLLAPGGTATFTIDDSEGDVFSMSGMLLPTNDGFAGLSAAQLPSTAGQTLTYNLPGYDAGTEANDEIVGSGAPGQAEGFVHIHRNVLGDLDANGGISDINATIHRWLNPVARVSITRMADAAGGVTAVSDLTGLVYSSTALEIFWQPATSSESYVTGYEIRRNGTVVDTRDGTSFFDQNLRPGVEYTYEVTPMDAAGNVGSPASVTLRTNAQ